MSLKMIFPFVVVFIFIAFVQQSKCDELDDEIDIKLIDPVG